MCYILLILILYYLRKYKDPEIGINKFISTCIEYCKFTLCKYIIALQINNYSGQSVTNGIILLNKYLISLSIFKIIYNTII